MSTLSVIRILATALLLIGVQAVVASAAARQPVASFVIDANTGQALYAHAADEPRYPASLTKMMTIYVVFDDLRTGRLRKSTLVRFSEYAASRPPSKLGLEPGETITIEKALRAVVTKSANDVATAIAEHISGSEEAFAGRMTSTARQLGMNATIFRNASGLPDPDQVTTARDMATLGLALQDNFPEYYQIFALRTFHYDGRRYRNHNRLLEQVEGVDGIKTGYTRASGFNLASSLRRDGKHVVAVVIGQRSGRVRNAVMRRLLARALPHASSTRTRPATGQPLLFARPTLAVRPVAANRPSIQNQPQASYAAIRSGSLAERIVSNKHRTESSQSRGRRPSSLDEQVSRLTRNPKSEGRRSGSPAPQPASSVRSAETHHVQVGAFLSEADAMRALNAIRAQAGSILAGHQALSVAASTPTRVIYRARFAGFDAQTALEACSKLKSVKVDCFATRMN